MSSLLTCRDRLTVTGPSPDTRAAQDRADTALTEQQYGVLLPPSYLAFLRVLGPGTLGGFLHLHPPAALRLHRERLQPFMDAELEVLLEETGDVLIFADSDNGDLCGWHLTDLRERVEPPMVRVVDFDEELLADCFTELLERCVAGEDVFEVGSLPLTFQAASALP